MMSEQSAVCLRPAQRADMRECAAILNRWIDSTSWMPRIHDHADVERHYRETVFVEREVIVAETRAMIAGFLALSAPRYITALYVDEGNRRSGIGRMLLDHAKKRYPKNLRLWTFVANSSARQFYEHLGFVEMRRTDGENEEGLPDILFEWSGCREETSP